MIIWLRFVAFAVLGICIAIADFRTHRIPNALLLVLIGLLAGIDLVFLGTKAIFFNFLAGLGAFGLFFVVFRLKGGLGFGDVKYAGVIGYFLGPWQVLSGLLCAVLLCLLYWCVGRLIFHWGKEKRLPFGPWLCCGAIAAAIIHRGLL